MRGEGIHALLKRWWAAQRWVARRLGVFDKAVVCCGCRRVQHADRFVRNVGCRCGCLQLQAPANPTIRQSILMWIGAR